MGEVFLRHFELYDLFVSIGLMKGIQYHRNIYQSCLLIRSVHIFYKLKCVLQHKQKLQKFAAEVCLCSSLTERNKEQKPNRGWIV